MIWYEITIHTGEEAVEAIANFLNEQGAGGVAIEESGNLDRPRDTSLGQWYEMPLNDIPEGEAVVQAYFADKEQADRIAEALGRFIEEIRSYPLDVGKAIVTVKAVEEQDWANGWKQYYKPAAVTDRLVVKPTWETYEARPGEIVLELDPGMAFGTGTHATTALCLKVLDRMMRPGMNIIDVGTGSGILAIAAAKLGASSVLALDLDPVAVSSARENVKLNGIESIVEVAQSDLLGVLRGSAAASELNFRLPAQLVVANILAEIILLFVKDVYDALDEGGIYIVSGVIERKKEEVRQALEQAGFHVERTETDQEWVVLTAVKR